MRFYDLINSQIHQYEKNVGTKPRFIMMTSDNLEKLALEANRMRAILRSVEGFSDIYKDPLKAEDFKTIHGLQVVIIGITYGNGCPDWALGH